MFKNVYVVLLSFLPLLSILGNEADYSNFYVLIVYNSILAGLGIIGQWLNKDTISISSPEVCMAFLCVISLSSALIKEYPVSHFIYYGIMSSTLLVMFSKNYVRERLPLLKKSLICVTLLINIVILVAILFDGNIMILHVGNSGILAIFISISVCTLLKITFSENCNKIMVKVGCTLLIAVDVIYIYMLESRTAFIVISIFLLVCSSYNKRYLRYGLLGVIVIVFAFAIIGNESKSQSFVGRSFILRNCFSLFAENPLVGTGGIGSFGVKYSIKQAQYFTTHTEMDDYFLVADNVIVACNEFVQLLCEVGIIGLGIVVFMIYYAIKHIKDGYFRNVLLFSVLISALFYYILHTALFCALGVICIIVASAYSPVLLKISFSRFNCLLLSALCVAGLVYSADHLRVSNSVRKCIDRRSLSDKQKIYIVDNFRENKIFLASLSTFDNSDGLNDKLDKLIVHSDILFHQGQMLRRNKRYELAERKLQLASYICPNRFRYKYELFKIYKETNNMRKANEIADHISRMPVKINSPTIFAIKKDIDNFLHYSCE